MVKCDYINCYEEATQKLEIKNDTSFVVKSITQTDHYNLCETHSVLLFNNIKKFIKIELQKNV